MHAGFILHTGNVNRKEGKTIMNMAKNNVVDNTNIVIGFRRT
jgi:hypothetical protein